MTTKSALRLLLCIGLLHASNALAGEQVLHTRHPDATSQRAGVAVGPRLPSLPAPPAATASNNAGNTYVDLPCDLFDPGKADPYLWMATSTIAHVTYDGVTYQHGYDPMAQSYDMMVSGFAHSSGVILQETVGVVAAPLPPILNGNNVLGVELWFTVTESNLFPQEFVGITSLDTGVPPSSSLDAAGMKTLFDDARGFSGSVYFLDHLTLGAHAIDLGPVAASHLAGRAAASGNARWFGVGFAADGWDLGGSLEELVFWKMAGGGRLPVSARPFFRVYYNAAPLPFALLSPADEAAVNAPQPSLVWEAAVDPDGGTPMNYMVWLGGSPDLAGAFQLPAGPITSIDVPFPLAPGSYYWKVVATDALGATGESPISRFDVVATTSAPIPAAELMQLAAYPNPFNPRTTLRFALDRAGPVRVSILDARGRHVITLIDAHRPAGAGEIRWNGRDHAGRPCASGVYMAVLETETGRLQSRLALVR